MSWRRQSDWEKSGRADAGRRLKPPRIGRRLRLASELDLREKNLEPGDRRAKLPHPLNLGKFHIKLARHRVFRQAGCRDEQLLELIIYG